MLAAGARVGGQRMAACMTACTPAPPARHPKQQQCSRARRRAGRGTRAAASGGVERAPPPPRVRRARPEDVPAIATLEAASAPLSAGWTAAQVEEELPREIAVVLVADKAQEDEAPSGNGDTAPLAGWAAAWRVAGELQVLAIAVDPARRRSGVGRALLDGLLALVDEDEDQDGGASSASPPPPLATLELRADNAAAAALYASCGFVEVGRRKGYYDGGRVDAVLLEKPRKG